ncbi:MAG TPA: energy-coupling factor transporter transmembrane component T [Pseudogracilibacillus sp.]|nr:energy-coupling factor transporter transmembrane component T [Pseudogracilibacillus sp.]
MNLFDLFTPQKKTWLYRVNPAVKFVLFFLLFMVVFFNQNYLFTMNIMIMSGLLLFLFSGYRLRRLLLFSIPVVVSIFSTAFTMILFGKGEIIWWQWGIIKISEESFYKGLLLGFKSASFGFLSLIFLLTSRPVMLFYALMQQLKLPAKFAYSFMAAIRLVPIIIDELQARSNAFKIRGVTFSKGVKGVFERMRLYMLPIFAQSIRRAQRLAIAMEAKRFQIGADRTYYYPTRYQPIDAVFSLVLISFSVGAYVLTRV